MLSKSSSIQYIYLYTSFDLLYIWPYLRSMCAYSRSMGVKRWWQIIQDSVRLDHLIQQGKPSLRRQMKYEPKGKMFLSILRIFSDIFCIKFQMLVEKNVLLIHPQEFHLSLPRLFNIFSTSVSSGRGTFSEYFSRSVNLICAFCYLPYFFYSIRLS